MSNTHMNCRRCRREENISIHSSRILIPTGMRTFTRRCERFLMEEKVAVISGSAFGAGGEGFVRCCYATSMKDIAEALTRMDNFLTNLRKKQAREG